MAVMEGVLELVVNVLVMGALVVHALVSKSKNHRFHTSLSIERCSRRDHLLLKTIVRVHSVVRSQNGSALAIMFVRTV